MMSEFMAHWSTRLQFVDVHYHAGPDSYVRRYSAFQTGEKYAQEGGAVVLKNHLGSVSSLATAMQGLGLPVFGSIVLNAPVGGISLTPVKQALSQYQFSAAPRLLVHLPTVVPGPHRSVMTRAFSSDYAQEFAGQPLSITDENGNLLREVYELIEFARQHNIVLSSGHSSKDQTLKLIEAVEKAGGCRLMLNQPANPMTGFSALELKALGSYEWLYVEQCALTVYLRYQSEDDMYTVLSEVNNVVYSSDLGQPNQPDVEEWRADSVDWFKKAGLTEEKIAAITKFNPLRMLDPERSSNSMNERS